MCGIAGVVGEIRGDPDRGSTVRRMAGTLVHRGPDGEGFLEDDRCALGFRRLAIVDVGADSPPYANENGSVWSVCNGEIYNAHELRAELIARGHRFRTEVDTEVLPHLYEEMGPDLVQRLDGMFAFAVWDRLRGLALLGRDRAGEKPLFYWHGPDELVFASELRAMLCHPRVPRELDPRSLRRFLLHDFFPAPHSPFAEVRKLPAGHVAVLERGRLDVRAYWDLAPYFIGESPDTDLDRMAEELDARIGAAIRRRRNSDVPVGVFLSGGLDSSTVLSHLAEQTGPGVPAFALGHDRSAFDESRLAARTARHFRADYHELILGRGELAEGLRAIGAELDEPLGDASTIPTYLLSRFARERVKVVLSGEGGDELFAGYPTYPGHRAAETFGRLPATLRRALASVARTLVPVRMGNVGLDYLLERFLTGVEMDRLERHHTWFGSIPAWRHPAILADPVLDALGQDDPYAAARTRIARHHFPDPLAELLYTDFTMYLQDDLLTKVDRATMLHSLEARGPFLDHSLVEFAASLPSSLKLRGATGKAILRRAVRRRLPPEILSRRKRGFNIPFSQWLLDGLGTELRRRFDRERVAARGLLRYEGVAALLDEHLERRADHRKPLFTLLALDLWCDRVYGEAGAVPLAAERPATPEPLAPAHEAGAVAS